MTVKKAAGALLDAKAAAEAEGIFEPTDEQRKALMRYRALKERMGAIKTEMDAIEATVLESMAQVGARALNVNGKNWVLISPVNSSEFYADQMEAEYPEIVAAFVQAKAAYDAHVPEFTFKVKKEDARKTFKP